MNQSLLTDESASGFSSADEMHFYGTKRSCGKITLIILAILIPIIALSVALPVIFVLRHKKIDTNIPSEPLMPELTFLYINDLHLNRKYNEKANRQADYCQGESTLITGRPFGQYKCDPPLKIIDSLIDNAKRVTPTVDFILLGGDIISHGKRTAKDLEDIYHYIVDRLSAKYPGKKIFITLGNNDFVINYGTFDTDKFDFEIANKVFGKYLNEEQQKTFLKGGYFAEEIPDQNLTILFLNTIVYTTKRNYNETLEDPYDQFAWIREMHKVAVGKGHKVGVALHMPPGVVFYEGPIGWHDSYIQKFSEILKDCTFSFFLSGHAHLDQFLPLYIPDSNKENILYSLGAPSVSPAHYNNPCYRVFQARDGVLTDFTQYYADILMNPQESLKWEVEYKFSEIYKTKDISQESIRQAVKWIQTTGEGQWRYREFVFSRADEHNSFHYCLLQAISPDDVKNCEQKLNRNILELDPYWEQDY